MENLEKVLTGAGISERAAGFAWDVQQVLIHLCSLTASVDLTNKLLIQKTTMLLGDQK